jgi:hypothetical protein
LIEAGIGQSSSPADRRPEQRAVGISKRSRHPSQVGSRADDAEGFDDNKQAEGKEEGLRFVALPDHVYILPVADK